MIDRLKAALIDRYRIERELGEGGMATVYLAEDLKHRRQVAVKVLRPELAAVVGAERFLAEIETTANLQHPHILPLFDSGEADSFLYYVMPFVEGESLRERLDRKRQLPVGEAVAIAAKVARALESAHRLGVVHRDIKPANILLADGEPLVADFGIALAVQHAGGGRLTETGLSLGTPFYMSPEQATADRDPGPASDVYSLGCVLYEMLVGEPPFTGPSAQAVVAKLITSEAPDVTEYRKTVPEHVAAAVEVALHKLPADRFATAAAFADAVESPGRLPAGGARRAGRGERARTGARWIPWIAASLGLGAALFFALRSPEQEPTRATRFSLGLPDASGTRAVAGPWGHIAISRDGGEIVFEGTEQGRRRLFRRSLDRVVLEPLPGTEDAQWPAFSEDGREIAFATPEGVFRLVLDGGTPRRVVTPPDIPIGISWAPDGTLLFGMLAYNMEFAGLTAIAASGEDSLRTLTEPEDMDHWPYVLPGGTHALYTDYGVDGGGLALIDLDDNATQLLEVDGSPIPIGDWVVGVAGEVLLYIDDESQLMATGWDPARRRVTTAAVPVPGTPAGLGRAAMAEDGTLAMTVGAPAYQLVEVDESGEILRLLAGDSVWNAAPRYSGDGSRVLVGASLQGGEREVWTVDLASGLLSQLSMGFAPEALEWSADGEEVLATDRRQSRYRGTEGELWSRPADAREAATRVAQFTGREIDGMHLHPDGAAVALTVDVGRNPSQRRYDVVVARVDGDTVVTPFATGHADEVAARFSPDGGSLAYASNESGRFQVYVRPFPGPGPRIQISAVGGGQPVWSRDGRRLYYRTDDALMVANLTRENGRLAVRGRERLFQSDLLGGPGSSAATYDVHPEGGRLVVTRGVGGSAGDVVVWRDWLPEIRPLLGLRP